MYDKDVVIIGAGPTGLTVAIELARRFIPFRIFDAADGPLPGSRGKGLQPRTLEIFDDLGVISKILQSGSMYPRIRLHFGLSILLGRMGGERATLETIPYPNLWLVPQHRTETILRERLAELGHHVEFNKSFESLSQDATTARVRFRDGATLTARYVVGCDGGRSVVRKALGLELRGDSLSDENPFIADVRIDSLDHNVWHIWPSTRHGVLGLCPLPEKTLFQMTLPRPPKTTIEDVLTTVTKRQPVAIDWTSSYRPATRMVDRYRVGRAFLAGDAAHVHPPTGGQGLNTGVQDAYNLGWKLAHVLRGGPESLLDTYEEERLPIAAAVLGLSKRLYKSRSLKRGDVTNQLALHYRESSLSSGTPLGNLHPGDRMPNLHLSDKTTLFDQMRGTHATEVQTKYDLRILVRPDGYIARIGVEPSDMYAGERTRTVRYGGDSIV